MPINLRVPSLAVADLVLVDVKNHGEYYNRKENMRPSPSLVTPLCSSVCLSRTSFGFASLLVSWTRSRLLALVGPFQNCLFLVGGRMYANAAKTFRHFSEDIVHADRRQYLRRYCRGRFGHEVEVVDTVRRSLKIHNC